MNATLETQAYPAAHTVKRESVLSLVRGLINGYPDPENPQPPGPWDPIIRKALARLSPAAGPWPDPWRIQEFGFLSRINLVALNPQPLPPGALALAQTMIEQITELHDLANLMPADVQNPVQHALSERLTRFIDDCGNGRVRFPKSRRPFPWPPPLGEIGDRLTTIELVVMGVAFENAAREAVAGPLHRDLAQAGAALIDSGLTAF